jgi:succinate dehydrogenase flavin-adding protein (antitoxin of CptAB toxin-antitoxin module)
MDEYKTLLKELGVKLPEHRLDRIAGKLARELELRVGNTITDHLSDEQLDEFESIIADAQKKQAQWLLKHYPDYEKVVAKEAEKIHKELLKAKSPAVLIKHWHQAKA